MDDCIQLLASTSPREYFELEQGQTLLNRIYNRCVESGLASVSFSNDVDKLHALFDVAVANNLDVLVLDYVHGVCSDPLITSNDPVEAYMMDGECIRKWCEKFLQKSQQRVMQLKSKGLAFARNSTALGQELSQVSSIRVILQALNQSAASQNFVNSRSAVAELLTGAEHLKHCLEAMLWVVVSEIRNDSGRGKHNSEQEWRALINKKAAASQPLTLFLNDMLSLLHAQQGNEGVQYPPRSLEKALEVFLDGPTTSNAVATKQAFFLYYLLDGGIGFDIDSFREFFGLSEGTVRRWHAQYLLDEAALGEPGFASLEQACAILPGIADDDLSFKLIEVLSARGAADTALAVLRARSASGFAASSLQEAKSGMTVKLECGLLAESYLEMKQYCGQVSSDQRGAHLRDLFTQLFRWAAQHSVLHSIIELPLSADEEAIAVELLQQEGKEGRAAAALLPLYYLHRGRIAEALAANAGICSSSGGSSKDKHLEAQRLEILKAAASMLPAPQRALRLNVQPGAAPDLQLSGSGNGEHVPPGVAILADLGLASGVDFPALVSTAATGDALPLLLTPVKPVDPAAALAITAAKERLDPGTTQGQPAEPAGTAMMGEVSGPQVRGTELFGRVNDDAAGQAGANALTPLKPNVLFKDSTPGASGGSILFQDGVGNWTQDGSDARREAATNKTPVFEGIEQILGTPAAGVQPTPQFSKRARVHSVGRKKMDWD